MTTKEERSVNQLHEILVGIRNENQKFREDIKLQVDGFDKKIEQKHLPLHLESDVVTSVQGAIQKSLHDALTGYNSPLTKYAQNVVAKYQTSIEAIFDKAVEEGISSDEFKLRVREVLLHKIAKTMIAGIDGSVDKTVNQMKQDAIFRSRLTLAVNGLVNEFLNQ